MTVNLDQMTINAWVQHATNTLKGSSTSPRLDAELLAAHVLKQSREWLHSHDQEKITPSQQLKLDCLLQKRIKHIPLAYLVGKKEFYGRSFVVTPDVLVPRPETEALVELALELRDVKSVLELGTGSGILAITLALNNPKLKVIATDTSKKVLAIAKKNAQFLGATGIIFKEQDLLSGDTEPYDLVIANLPYVPTTIDNSSIKHEPQDALFSGPDGLDTYKMLFTQLQNRSTKPRYLILEALEKQHADLIKLAEWAGFSLSKSLGLGLLFSC